MARRDDEIVHLHEYPDGDDLSSVDLTDTVVCPNCRKLVFEGSRNCACCGAYIPWPDEPAGSSRPFVVVGLVLLVLAVLGFVLM